MKGMGECCGRGMRFEIFSKKVYNHESTRTVPYEAKTLLRLWEVNSTRTSRAKIPANGKFDVQA
jgi:hypothetical protein